MIELPNTAERFKRNVQIENMTVEQLKHTMCAESKGNVRYCRNTCNWKCMYGERLIELEKRKNNTVQAFEDNAEKMKREAINKYIEACKSGNPVVYLLDHGTERVETAKVNWYSARKKYHQELEEYLPLVKSISIKGTKYSKRSEECIERQEEAQKQEEDALSRMFDIKCVEGKYGKYEIKDGKLRYRCNFSDDENWNEIDLSIFSGFIEEIKNAEKMLNRGKKNA